MEMHRSIQEETVFIPGKNWKLSLAEIVAFLETKKKLFEIVAASKEFFIIKLREDSEGIDIADLGGVIKIGRARKSFSTDLFKASFLEKGKENRVRLEQEVSSSDIIGEMLEKGTGKYTFGVSVYNAEETLRSASRGIQRYVGSAIKQKLREHDVKSDFLGFPRDRQCPQLTHVEVLKKGLVEKKAEVLVCLGKQQTWLATTSGVHDPFEFQKRDIGKPRQRKIFAIPPRLARIMVNLSSCAAGTTLLDPFCGVGTILQEALLAKAKVVGLDSNPWCVEAANTNLRWITEEYGLKDAQYRVLRGDALNLAKRIGYGVDCIVTEPDLGPALRDMPTTPYALKIIKKLEPLFLGFLEEACKVLVNEGRLVLVTPYIRTRSGEPVKMNIEKPAEENGFRKIQLFRNEFFSENKATASLVGMATLLDIGERHKIGREIHILQK